MRGKRNTVIVVIVTTLLLIMYGVFYIRDHYVSSVDKAMVKSNIKFSEIYHLEKIKNYLLVFYGYNDILSMGIVKNTAMGYDWIYGFGSKMFNEKVLGLNNAFTNLPTQKYGDGQHLISLTFGVIYDKKIDKLKVKYKDQDFKEATIFKTAKGTIWYCISDSLVNYDPSFIGVSKDGEVVFRKN